MPRTVWWTTTLRLANFTYEIKGKAIERSRAGPRPSAQFKKSRTIVERDNGSRMYKADGLWSLTSMPHYFLNLWFMDRFRPELTFTFHFRCGSDGFERPKCSMDAMLSTLVFYMFELQNGTRFAVSSAFYEKLTGGAIF